MNSGVTIVVVADANVLLAAVAGKAAAKVLDQPVEIHTTIHTVLEVMEYMVKFSTYYGVHVSYLLKQFKSMPLRVWDRKFYKEKCREAELLIGKRDPKDVDVLALTLKLDVPIWTNDNDFKGLPIKRYTTAQLLKKLGM